MGVRRLPGARGAEKQGVEAAEGLGSGEGVSPLQLGLDLGRGCTPPKEIFVKFTMNSLILQHFVRITTV